MPQSASFSVRRPNYRRRRTFAVLGLLVVAVVVVLLLTRDGGPVKPGEPPIPTLHFVAKATHVFQGKAAGPGTQQGEVDALTKLFDEFYQEAFVDPEKWGDGMFEDLADRFADDAKPSFKRDLPSLTIAATFDQIRRVDLGPNSLALSIYYDSKQKPTFATAAVKFAGTGTLKKSGPRVAIVQAATFYLQKMGSVWKITAYDTNETQNTPSPSPTASPS